MNYFPKIDQSLHPERKKFFKKIYIKNQVYNKFNNYSKDKEILLEIIELEKKFNIKQFLGGTWEWVEKNKRNYKNNLELETHFERLNNFFRNDLSFGLISSHWKKLIINKGYSEKIVSDILKNISAWEEFTKTKESDYKLLDSNKAVGNPYGIIFKKRLILYDTPRHDYYANKIKNLVFLKNKVPTILEIGGGYGGLLSQLIKRNLKFNYINIDLFKTLQVAYYSIRKEFKKKNIFLKFYK